MQGNQLNAQSSKLKIHFQLRGTAGRTGSEPAAEEQSERQPEEDEHPAKQENDANRAVGCR
jgi:hypothetical protein